MTALPHRLARSVRDAHEEQGIEWLTRLPTIVAECAGRWSLELASPLHETAYSYVAPAIRCGTVPVVLKLAPPWMPDLLDEEIALRWYSGKGAVQVLESDPSLGALLLERIVPGDPVTCVVHDGHDDEATLAIARVMRRLWSATDEAASVPRLPSIDSDTAAIPRLRTAHAGTTGPLPSKLVEIAEDLAAELLRSSAGSVVLHADLHHNNVLSSDRDSWLAIDPKGRLGEPACEAAALLRNPLPELPGYRDLRARLARRADLLAEVLHISRERLLGWALVLAVVAACWQLEDHDAGWDACIRVANALCDSM